MIGMDCKRIGFALLLLTVSILAGCGGSAQFDSIGRYHVAGHSTQGLPVGCVVLGSGQDVTFILASIHGNEAAGTPLVQRLALHLQENTERLKGRTVVLMAEANPDGIAKWTRHNSRGVDLNRNFYSDNRVNSAKYGRSAMSETESRIIAGLIWQYGPDKIVSIHQVKDKGPGGLARRYPNGLIDYDGPSKPLAEYMAEYCELNVAKLGASPGSLGNYGGELLRIPTITFELPYDAYEMDHEILWDRYGGGLVAAVTFCQEEWLARTTCQE